MRPRIVMWPGSTTHYEANEGKLDETICGIRVEETGFGFMEALEPSIPKLRPECKVCQEYDSEVSP